MCIERVLFVTQMARVGLRDVKSKEEFVRMIKGAMKGMISFSN